MENFKSFITEQKDEKYKVVVISNELGDKAITAERIKSEARELNYPSYIVPMDGTYLKLEDGIRTIHKDDDDHALQFHLLWVCFLMPTYIFRIHSHLQLP